MALQVQRFDVDDNHRQQSQVRHQQLLRQRADLAQALRRSCHASICGLLRFPVYRQFKMYNDAKYR
jgi:succinate dehydrogenase/fumarate reductase-like Fe-S protein